MTNNQMYKMELKKVKNLYKMLNNFVKPYMKENEKRERANADLKSMYVKEINRITNNIDEDVEYIAKTYNKTIEQIEIDRKKR